MSEIKLSSDEVPVKCADWLLAMACPSEIVPTVDKMSQLCRGTYYLVWRSLMEQVESTYITKQKRLQVFADDVRRCKKKNLFTEHDTNVLIPPELTMWRQQADIRLKVLEAATRIAEQRLDLNEVMDKVSSKMAQRNLARQRAQDWQRRSWLLQLLAEDLRGKKQALAETRTIAEDMCTIYQQTDVQAILDRCLSSQRRQPSAVASSTMISSTPGIDLDEESIAQLVQCRGDALWAEFDARRAALVNSLSSKGDAVVDNNRPSVRTVLSETAALQSTLTLEALKCREMTRLAQGRLAEAVGTLNSQLTSECCEHVVVRCERACTVARESALRALLQRVAAAEGLFAGSRPARAGPARAVIHLLDNSIESKKENMKSVISSIFTTERKMQNVRECLAAIFNGFRSDWAVGDVSSTRGLQLDLPLESVASLRQFYERRRKMELSMEFDVTENSFNDISDLSSARFIDELRIYLKKFNLVKNRKLVLDSGDKIWIFQTLESAGQTLHARWRASDMTNSIICPSQSLSQNIRSLASVARDRRLLRDRTLLRDRETGRGDFHAIFDINRHIDEENQIMDKLMKRLDENLRSLTKISKTLDQGRENLSLWSNNQFRNHISQRRTVDGKPYKACEAYYLETLSF